MKTSHIFWGVFFISIGGLVLLGNLTTLNFTWHSAWKFWPMVLVLIGVSILVKNKFGKGIVAGLAALVLALTLYASVSATTNLFHNNINFVFDDDYNSVYDTTNYIEDFSDSIKTATINFKGGAGEFKLITPTDKLAKFHAEGYEENYIVNRNDNGAHSEIDFNMKNTKIRLGKNNYRNNVEISLNSKPEWELNFDVGAASLDLDLTPYKVSKVDVDMGAAALKIKFGDLTDLTRFKLNAGASDIDILIPDSTGCEINSDVALSSKNYEGFKKVSKHYYRTENFDTSKKRIYLEIDGGVSSIDVRKY
jgi:hypothetical protein